MSCHVAIPFGTYETVYALSDVDETVGDKDNAAYAREEAHSARKAESDDRLGNYLM
jgi:hypothetical protein